MLYNRLFISFLALLSAGGIGVGSTLLHKTLYPKGVEWIPFANEMELKYEVWDDSFTNPGICIEKLFPDVLDTNLFTRVDELEDDLTQLPGPYHMFKDDKPIKGKPAVGCVMINLKKFEYGKGYWRHALRGEVILKTENEGWIWMMGQSTGDDFNFRQIQLKKDEQGKWFVQSGHAGRANGGIDNLPKKSRFWHMDYHSNPEKECVDKKVRNNHATNRDICKALEVENVKSVKWTGVWTEYAGHQNFSSWVENPTDMIFSWPPANKKQSNKTHNTKDKNTRKALYYEGKWYNDKSQRSADHMILHWDDNRKGIWRELNDVCSDQRRLGHNREYSDSISDIFCSQTKPKRFIGNKGYDNI